MNSDLGDAGLEVSAEQHNAFGRTYLNKGLLVFGIGGVTAVSPWVAPPTALLLGLAVGLFFAQLPRAQTARWTRVLLQAAVVALGFGMNLGQVAAAGRSGFVYTAFGIAATLTLGTLLGKALGVESTAAFLISTGTAICGGSAIAAVGPVTGATDDQMSVSLGTVFVLNSLALMIFPGIGMALRLSQSQFGLWAAIAIHDTSSVVGAATKYGSVALVVATTIKLTRALWIVPMTLGIAAVKRSSARVRWPWFIVLFALAAVVNTYVGSAARLCPRLAELGKHGLTLCLYLIGTGMSRASIKQVGLRPMLQGTVLWIVVAAVSLLLIKLELLHAM